MRILSAAVAIVTALFVSGALAQDKPAARKDLVLNGDAKCTRCHDAEDNPQILQIGKSKHGVRGDARTPTCASCHGESDNHVNNVRPAGSTERPKPDRTFTKKSNTPPEERAE